MSAEKVTELLPAKLPEMKAGGKIQAIVPQSLDDAYRLAKAVCLSGLAPRGLDKPESAMIAILHGMEIGLTPMMALQKIAVINSRPTLWGDGALGLVRGSGLCKYVKEQISGDGDARTATCETHRAGEPVPVTRTFSIADAKRAGLWGKQGPWVNYPERMLQMRARAFALRDAYADVLGGMYLAEELQGTEPEAPTGHYSGTPTARLTPPPAPVQEAHESAPSALSEPLDEATERHLDRNTAQIARGEAWEGDPGPEAEVIPPEPPKPPQATRSAPSEADQRSAALAWADKAVTAMLGFSKKPDFDAWYTHDTMARIARVKNYDTAKHIQLVNAVDMCLDKFNPIGGG